jgi:Tol biopolymer transport system component
VALKVLPQEMAADPERRTRFEREARAVAALNHPNNVTIHSVEDADGVHFITMELVEGQTLGRMLPKNGFPLSQLLEIAIPLADAVSSAHRTGITHRDLKPDNIMVDHEGRLRVLDFGLAKLHDPAGGREEASQAPTAVVETGEGRIVGTVAYMSPEQAEGKAVDPRSDVFSLGTILFEMATGERPFRGKTSMSTISAILKDEPALVTDRNRALPRQLGRVIRRCLAKNPDRRCQTALDLRNELEELKAEVDSGELAAEPGLAAGRPRRLSRALLVVGAVAVLATVAVVAFTLRKSAEVPPAVYASRPITASIGWKCDLNWSPESEFMAYSEVISGSLDMMVKPVAGGNAVVRAGGPGDQVTPRWSADGKYLAFVSTSEPGSSVFVMPPHGGSPRRLIETNIPTLDVDLLTQAMGDRPWSPDGRTLLVSRATPLGPLAIFRVDRDNGGAEQLTHPPAGSDDLGASHSFDGQRVVFQRRANGRGALLTMAKNGGAPEALLEDQLDNISPAWRQGDRSVMFRSDRGMGIVNLWEIEVATGAISQKTFGTLSVYGLSVSADDRIAYAPYWHDTFLFAVDLATGDKRQLTSHTEDNYGARVSPDGRTIAYHSTRTGDSEIWLHHLDGRPETRVTDHPSWDLYPDWSPDGRRLVFVSNREGPFKIFIANSDGGNVRRLVDQPVTLRKPFPINAELVCRWSPNGERISYLVAGDAGNALWTVRPDGGDARKVLDKVIGFDWYRDSGHAIYSRHLGSEYELVAVDFDSGREQMLFVGPLMEIDVAPDGSAVSFCFGRSHSGMGLARLRLEPPPAPGDLPSALGEPEYVVHSEGTWHVHNGGWSPDSKTLVYTRDMDYSNIYEFVERR